MTPLPRKLVAGAFAGATLGLAVLTTATPAAAQWRRGWGGPVAAGVIGGLALGAIAGSAAARPVYPAPGFYGPPPPPPPVPVYYPGPPAYEPYCYTVERPVRGYYGEFLGYRPVRVCR